MINFLMKLFTFNLLKNAWGFNQCDLKTRKRYVKLILDKCGREIRNNNNIPNLLDIIKEKEERIDRFNETQKDSYEIERECEIKIRHITQIYQDNLNKKDMEIVHLKDLIQAKDLIIEKLNQESQKSL